MNVLPVVRIALAGLALTVATAAPGLAQDATAPARVHAPDHQFVIGPGDVLEIAVWDNTLISRTVPVRPDGRISLPLLHDVRAAGLTPMQLSEFLNTALVRYLEAPSVTVIVREVHSFKVSVIGQVKTPGRLELTSRATVLDVLAMAGGLTEFADRAHIAILRLEGTATRQIKFSYDRLATNGQQNFVLEPDDIILVP